MTDKEIPKIPEGVYPILLGVVGSRLYGTDHAGSDFDWKGVYQAPTRQILGIRETPDSYNFHHPDFTMYELGRFVSLLLKSNPTVIELLHLPEYDIITPQGQMLVDNRALFMQREKIAQAYHGFAHGQRRDLLKGKSNPKAIVHLFRVLWQGGELLLTGNCVPRMTPEQIALAREYAALDVDQLAPIVDNAMNHFDSLERESILPIEADLDAINDFLVALRTTCAPDPLV